MIFWFEVAFFDRSDSLRSSQKDVSNLVLYRLTLECFICYHLDCVSRTSLNGLLIGI